MRILYLSAAIVLVDQITKMLVKGFSVPFLDLYHHGVPLGASIPVLGDFVRLTFIENPGMAFGIEVTGKIFVTVFTALAGVGILYYLYKIRNERFLVRLPLAMILGGAAGNLIDRVFYGVLYGDGPLLQGKVVDFIDVDFFDISLFGYDLTRWFVFNVADASVSLGVVLLLFFHRHLTRGDEPLAVSPAPSEAAQPEAPGAVSPAAQKVPEP
jgi:signal peptidase II